MSQLELPLLAARPAEKAAALPERPPTREGESLLLAERLGRLLGEAVEIELTDNAWTMVSYQRKEGRLRFRLHHMFAGAHERVVRALAGFTGRSRRAHGRAIDDYIRQNRHLIRSAPKRREPLLFPCGRVHHLGEIFADLNARHFDNAITARIGWGRRPREGRRRSIKMGVYFHDQQVIRIHPALDGERVPRLFVELVVFHEMLHQAIPPAADGRGRRVIHGKEFRARERRFPGFEEARVWEKKNLHLLLRKRG